MIASGAMGTAIICTPDPLRVEPMKTGRRHTLQALCGAALLPCRAWTGQADAPSPGADTVIRLNLPGPGSLPFLPLELISALGFDREIGARLVLRYHPSGIRALEDVLVGNADFAALGFPTLPVLLTKGKDTLAIAPISGEQHVFHLLVRKDLSKNITRIKDLAGRTIGTSTGSPNGKTYLQMVVEIVLKAHGVAPQQVRWLPTGQNWESASGAFITQAADALFCEQPFPNRLIREGLGVSLLDLSDKRTHAGLAGIGALRSVVATHRALLNQPEGQRKAELMVRMLRRTLVWLRAATPQAVAHQASMRNDKERQDITELLTKTPYIYSADARFDLQQVQDTDVFLRTTQGDLRFPPAISRIETRWAGQQA
jgi:NitT/TauT family transport system substrate-binding protein